jgi:hypothetical protein
MHVVRHAIGLIDGPAYLSHDPSEVVVERSLEITPDQRHSELRGEDDVVQEASIGVRHTDLPRNDRHRR